MAATGLSAAAAAERLEKEGLSSCVVACDNSPTSTTLSGAPHLFFVFALCFFNGQCHSYVIAAISQKHDAVRCPAHAPSSSLQLTVMCHLKVSSANINLTGCCITGMTLCTPWKGHHSHLYIFCRGLLLQSFMLKVNLLGSSHPQHTADCKLLVAHDASFCEAALEVRVTSDTPCAPAEGTDVGYVGPCRTGEEAYNSSPVIKI